AAGSEEAAQRARAAHRGGLRRPVGCGTAPLLGCCERPRLAKRKDMIGLLLLAQLQAFRAEASGNLATADDYIPSTSSAPSWGRPWARTGRPWPRTTP